jgi:hypothetical protein
MPLVQTRGAASAQGFGEFAQAAPAANYIEDVFSTYLYTGTGANQTITNGIDLSTKGGLVWTKRRSGAVEHFLYDTTRGATKSLSTNDTTSEYTNADTLTAFGSTGFTLGTSGFVNASTQTFASWTFRKQPKFFDIVTFTTNSSKPPNTGNIAHNLGSIPGCVMIKNTGAAQDWFVYHRGTEGGGFLAKNRFLQLNTTGAAQTSTDWINVSSTNISFPGSALDGDATYVAYLFAHDAGGFGTSGTDNVISCGSFTTDGSGNATINLGYEPQWLLTKWSNAADNWHVFDDMRGFSVNSNGTSGNTNDLYPNSSSAEVNRSADELFKTATGFNVRGSGASRTYIYMAIRRGPMKVPTTGTSVFSPVLYSGNNGSQSITAGFPVDMELIGIRNGGGNAWEQGVGDRLRGNGKILATAFTSAENDWTSFVPTEFQSNTGTNRTTVYLNSGGLNFADWMFRRAPSFFDVVCYTGTGSTTTITHNLGVTPELVITKSRSQALGWVVWATSLPSTSAWIRLDTTDSVITSPVGYGGTFSASNYTIANTGPFNALNNSGSTYVAYLFASCPGVSKVGTYTGNGTSQAIACGFTGGARFVLIKRTDAVGGWYVYDTARGMTLLTDPYLFLNSDAAEVATLGSVTTTTGGFTVDATVLAAINTNAASYIFLAIA